MKTWHFFEPVTRSWVVLFIGPGEEFKKEMDDIGFDDGGPLDHEGANGLCIELNQDNNETGNDCIVLWMPKWSTATLVHEITHMVMMQFVRCHYEISRANTEPFAFHTEYWFTTIQRVRKKWPNGRTPHEARKNK